MWCAGISLVYPSLFNVMTFDGSTIAQIIRLSRFCQSQFSAATLTIKISMLLLSFFRASRWFCLFFILYVLLGVYFVANLFLAVVYDSFKSQV